MAAATHTATTPVRLSEYYFPTLKETPAEAELASHKLLLRAGFMRKTAAGVYTLLPLGWRVVRKIEQIVREEMDAVDAREMRMPILQPRELWDESGRWNDYGPELMRLHDRHEREFCLGPTHEEIITALIAADIHSYRQLPFCLYQMNTKFRDEIRPRFGLLRGREFLMKDAYSFHATPESLSEYYEVQAAAYGRICDRMGLIWRRVEADSGQIGGKVTAEFMALADAGESDIVYCDCGFAADIEVFQGDQSDEARAAAADEKQAGECVPDVDATPAVCPTCGQALQRARGIEVGQVFEVGPKYSQAMGVNYTDESGVEHPIIMGCYGWGITRSLAAAVEQHNDEAGIIWPVGIAPYEVCVIRLGDDEAVAAAADALAAELASAGVEVVIDDRAERPGVKFNDADLIGWPVQVVVGARGLAAGTVEVKLRATGDKHDVACAESATHIQALLS
ncbi:MAG: proline--tRNA ligase [Actinomycetes bacterium]|jgi:prolyl-tRNA synthetase|nr:proline--tRNA ligase [Actinomycetes bacterium]